jgi:hypothetical protein
MATFLAFLERSGPEWNPALSMEAQTDWVAHATYMDELVGGGTIVLGGPLADKHRVVLVMEADSESVIREALARDPWSESHLVVERIEPWTIRLDGRR